MSEADKLFNELGYKKYEEKFENEIETVEYRKIIKDDIYEQIEKVIEINNPKIYKFPIIRLFKILPKINRVSDFNLSLQELEAIYKKCKELEWIK